uniref:Phosphopantethiene--protein transferase domain containing protein, putative n=1 Tax=Neospora caninum (strain Liverpool) TaxID=572307 RepID=A0A0F7UBE4_NEOCL|nr:TPA: phosphopantethiene--protein transferase domain containing protein, putative [Neospora caninum Liverpool]
MEGASPRAALSASAPLEANQHWTEKEMKSPCPRQQESNLATQMSPTFSSSSRYLLLAWSLSPPRSFSPHISISLSPPSSVSSSLSGSSASSTSSAPCDVVLALSDATPPAATSSALLISRCLPAYACLSMAGLAFSFFLSPFFFVFPFFLVAFSQRHDDRARTRTRQPSSGTVRWYTKARGLTRLVPTVPTAHAFLSLASCACLVSITVSPVSATGLRAFSSNSFSASSSSFLLSPSSASQLSAGFLPSPFVGWDLPPGLVQRAAPSAWNVAHPAAALSSPLAFESSLSVPSFRPPTVDNSLLSSRLVRGLSSFSLASPASASGRYAGADNHTACCSLSSSSPPVLAHFSPRPSSPLSSPPAVRCSLPLSSCFPVESPAHTRNSSRARTGPPSPLARGRRDAPWHRGADTAVGPFQNDAGEDEDQMAEVDAYLDSLERDEARRGRARKPRGNARNASVVRAWGKPASSLRGCSSPASSSVREPRSSSSQASAPRHARPPADARELPLSSCEHRRAGLLHAADAAATRKTSRKEDARQEHGVESLKQRVDGEPAGVGVEDWGEGEVTIDRDEDSLFPLDEGLLARQASAVLEILGLRTFSVSVHLIDAEKMRQLNKAQRGTDAPTDVLAFPARSPRVYQRVRRFLAEVALREKGHTRERRNAASTATETLEDWEATRRHIRLRSSADLTLGEVFFCPSVIQAAIDADRREVEKLADDGSQFFCQGSGIKDLLKLRLSVPERLPLLFMHASLHLLGFDHEEDEQAAEMEAVEEALFARFLKQAQARALLQGGGPAAPHFFVGTGLDICSISRMRKFLLRRLCPESTAADGEASGGDPQDPEKGTDRGKRASSCGPEGGKERYAGRAQSHLSTREVAAAGEGQTAPGEIEEPQQRRNADATRCMHTRRLKRALRWILTPLEILEFRRQFEGMRTASCGGTEPPTLWERTHASGERVRACGTSEKAPNSETDREASGLHNTCAGGTGSGTRETRESEENKNLMSDKSLRKKSDVLSRNLQGAAAFLAGRFAAKEALAKAMGGSGLRSLSAHGIRMRDVEIYRGLNGQPLVRLLGDALEHQRQKRISSVFISITGEGDMAMATATAVGT